MTTKKMGILLGRELKFLDLRDSPRQRNNSDCGVFVCVLMRHLLLNRLLKSHRGEKVSMSMGHKEIDASVARKEILKTIEEFRKEGEKRKS